MKKPVQNTHRGLSIQNKVVMLLFLQFLADGNFSHVVFEDDDWEDATFHFSDDKRIFLEVKDITSRSISLSFIKREVFPGFIKKFRQVAKQDRILVAGPNFDGEVQGFANSLEYLSDWTKPKLTKKGFSEAEISLLSKTITFEYNEWLDINIMAYLSTALGFWLPETELEKFKDHLLQKVAIAKASEGDTLTRPEFADIVAHERKALKVGIFDPEKHSNVERVTEVLNTLASDRDRSNTIENPRVLSSLMSNPSDVALLMMVLEKEVTTSGSLDLNKWTPLFEAAIHPAYAFRLVHLFGNILKIDHSHDQFFVEFWTTNITKMIPPYQDGHLVGEILRMASGIVNNDASLADQVFDLLEQAIRILSRGKYEDKVSYAHDSHDRNQLGILAKDIYKQSDRDQKDRVLAWTHEHFNLNREHGEFLAATPSSIYQLWKSFVMSSKDRQRIEQFIKIVEEDYLADPDLIATRGKKKGSSIYEGFDHMGSGISQSGDVYSITDLAFVEIVLKPFVQEWYESDPNSLWEYLPNWVSSMQNEVGTYANGKKPDFLSRAIVPVLMSFYFIDDRAKSQQSYKWLTSFMMFRKGIPSRTDLIFQELYHRHPDASKTWRLVKYQLDIKEYNKAPANIFVEQLLRILISSGLSEPVEYVSGLISNETYLRYRGSSDFYLSELITSLISNDSTKQYGIQLLQDLLSSSFFNEQISDFDVYDIKSPIQALFVSDFNAGCKMLSGILAEDKPLSKNRQIALTVYLRDMSGDRANLENVYEQVFRPLVLIAAADHSILTNKLTFYHSREELAEFAGRLCKSGSFDYALEILNVLIHDPSPSDDEYLEDMLKPNDMHALQSVRAHVSWALQSFLSIDGRPYLDTAFLLLKTLAEDKNIFIRSQACFPLTAFVQGRHYHMPEGENVRYMDSSLVNKVDTLVLSLLNDKDNHKYPSLTKGIVHVVSYMRALSTNKARKIVDGVLDSNDTGIEDYIPTLMFFAEFRQEAFTDWPWESEFPIGVFDPVYFQECMLNLAEHGSDDVKRTIAWHLWTGITKKEIPQEKAIQIVDRYAGPLISVFGREWYSNLYHLANDLVKIHDSVRGLDIWKRCIQTEYDTFENKDTLETGYRGHHYDGEMLVVLHEAEGNESFQHWLELILSDRFDTYLSNVKDLYTLANAKNREVMLNLYPHVLLDEITG